ncbi:MAG: DJ-1/PfpI family protein [Oscillospiraceae bacterium]|nr:DJ-1/PfpI family protein [Oscillospiraceae bacterium]MBQ8732816.1 DJ-1/PfpI family protein [Oscillospiraceae bacterium]
MIYVFLANGFEETEAIAPIDILRRAELEVKTVGVGGKEITGAHGITVTADLTEGEISLSRELEMVVLPGGMPGTLNLEASFAVKAAVQFCADRDRYVGAICAAPSVLGHMGLLEGKNATCYPGFEQELLGAELPGFPVCKDGKIITANGAGNALEFGFVLAECLAGKEKADALRAAMMYQ